MANEQNLRPGEYKLSKEEAKKGGIASGKARQEKKTMKKAIEWLLNSDIKITKGSMYDVFKNYGIDISKLDTTQIATLGLWYGAVTGNATNYKTIMEANNEITEGEGITAPTLKIEVVDNSKLEGVMYEENRHNENDK